jgi:hypothetical protein
MRNQYKILSEKYDAILEAPKKALRKKPASPPFLSGMPPDEKKDMCLEVMECGSYEQALQIVKKYYDNRYDFVANTEELEAPIMEICREKGIPTYKRLNSDEYYESIPYHLGQAVWYMSMIYPGRLAAPKSRDEKHYRDMLVGRAQDSWDRFFKAYYKWSDYKKATEEMQKASDKANIKLDI